MSDVGKIDKFFLYTVIALLVLGYISFVSASFGVLARSSSKFWSIMISQTIGLVLGGGLMYWFSRIDYKLWRKYAFFIFIISIGLTILVFIPSISLEHGGARRWIDIGPISFQPVEILKIAFVMYFAGWLSWVKWGRQDPRSERTPRAFARTQDFFERRLGPWLQSTTFTSTSDL
jgi:cell division protein FtsW